VGEGARGRRKDGLEIYNLLPLVQNWETREERTRETRNATVKVPLPWERDLG
jgi:hypothetical protein